MGTPATGWAQRNVFSAELGSARLRFADSIDATALSLTPTWRFARAQSSFVGTATLSHLAGAWSNSTMLDGSWMRHVSGRFSLEAEGVAGGSAHSDGTRTAQLMALGRGHFTGETGGVWLGLGVGVARDVVWRDVRQSDVGGWLTRAATEVVARMSPTAVDDTLTYADVQLWANHTLGRWELHASLGARIGDPIATLSADRKSWGSASAALWVTPRVALVASGGTYPIDYTQGYPGGQYVSLSVRVRSRDNLDITTQTSVANGVHGFDVGRTEGQNYRIRVNAPHAASVEVSGDFTQWTPVSLARDSAGWWVATLAIKEGTHEVAIRVDRGAWRAPPGLTPITDEFGGQSGLLVVPK